MQDEDVIINSLLQRLEDLQKQLLAGTERQRQKDKLIEQLMAENRQLAESNLKLQKRIAHPEPATVRYAWCDYPVKMNLYNAAGLPVVPFQIPVNKG